MLMTSLQVFSPNSRPNKIQFQAHQPPSLLLHLFLLLLLVYRVNSLVQADIFFYACSQEKFQVNSLFQGNLNSFLVSVVSSSSQVSYNSFALGNGTTSAAPGSTIFGLYQCRGDMTVTDCSRCIEGAVNQINLLCPYSYGASLQLGGCSLRYEHTDFLGKLDTTLVFKKCSNTSVDNDAEFFRRRDDVLADLQTAVGFKVRSVGSVEGYAQCLGDLSPSDCSACLVAAVGQLKNLCGSAAAADVFLGQCYARYWAAGYYNVASDYSSKEDDVGKTAAIIIGTIAGLAVFIVLLSLCRRSMG